MHTAIFRDITSSLTHTQLHGLGFPAASVASKHGCRGLHFPALLCTSNILVTCLLLVLFALLSTLLHYSTSLISPIVCEALLYCLRFPGFDYLATRYVSCSCLLSDVPVWHWSDLISAWPRLWNTFWFCLWTLIKYLRLRPASACYMTFQWIAYLKITTDSISMFKNKSKKCAGNEKEENQNVHSVIGLKK